MSQRHDQALRLLAEKIRLDRPHRWNLYAAFGLLAASGIAWLVLHYLLAERVEDWPIPTWEGWSMKLHGLAAMLSLIATGTLIPNHIRRAWYLRRNLGSGLTLSALALALALTGYWLYYFVSEESQELVSAIHWVVGLGAVLVLPLHIVLGRGKRARTPSPAARSAKTGAVPVKLEQTG